MWQWSEDVIRFDGPGGSKRSLIVRPEVAWTVLQEPWLSRLDERLSTVVRSDRALTSGRRDADEQSLALLVKKLAKAGFLADGPGVAPVPDGVPKRAGDWRGHPSEWFRRWDEGCGSSVICMVTNACNLDCPYCLTPSEGAIGPTYMSVDTARQCVSVLGSAGQCRVTLSGGEPLLHRRFFEIVDAWRPVADSLALNTNGTLIDSAETAQRIAEAVDCVTISIDGHDGETHDRYRGKGTFAKSLAAIRLLKEAGEGCWVQMRTILTPGCDEDRVRELGNQLEVETKYTTRVHIVNVRASRCLEAFNKRSSKIVIHSLIHPSQCSNSRTGSYRNHPARAWT